MLQGIPRGCSSGEGAQAQKGHLPFAPPSSEQSQVHEHAMAVSCHVFSDFFGALNLNFAQVAQSCDGLHEGRCKLVVPSLPLICRLQSMLQLFMGGFHQQSSSDPSARGYHDAWKGKGTG